MQNVTKPISTAGLDHPAAAEKRGIKARALDELKRFIVITLYLWALFSLFSIYKGMILRENGINVWAQSFAIINALIFAKVILLAQALNLDASLRKYPLVYSVLGNSLSFTFVLFAFHILEEAVRAKIKGLSLATSIADFGGGNLAGFLTMGAIFFVALIPFFTFQEVARVVGGRALWDLFFTSEGKASKLSHE